MDVDHPEDLSRRLRAELVAFVNACGVRRVVPPVFHIGVPGGRRGRDQVGVAEAREFDSGLRADLVDRCLDCFDPGEPVLLPWLTRSGDLVAHDVDHAWAAAAREAFGRHGRAFPGFWVITRSGWMDLATSVVTEQRIRRRR